MLCFLDFVRSLLKFVESKREFSSVQFNVAFSIFNTYYIPPPGGYFFRSVCLFVCLFVCLSPQYLKKVLDQILVEFSWKSDETFIKKSVCKRFHVAEINEKMLDCAHYPYIMQIVSIHKHAELTKNNGLDSSIVYRIKWS